MHDLVSFNYQITSPSEINLSPVTSIALYGKGIFTTIAISGLKPFLWKKHWRRLKRNANVIGLELSRFDEDDVMAELCKLLHHNETQCGRARITFFDESHSKIWNYGNRTKTSLLIQTSKFVEVNKRFHVDVSDFRVNSASPLSGIKSCNYLDNLIAFENAKSKGFDEAVRLNERDEVVSACMANIFWVKDTKLFTPALETGCLAGTTREWILENQEVNQTLASLKRISDADEIFLTSAGIGLRASGIGEVKTMTNEMPIFSKLKKTFDLEVPYE